MKGKCRFFYQHSLAACTHTLRACKHVDVSVIYYVNAAPLHHSCSRAKHCRIINSLSLFFTRRKLISCQRKSLLSLLTESQLIEMKHFVDIFVQIMSKVCLLLFSELRSHPTAESLQGTAHKCIINSPQPCVNHSYLEQIDWIDLGSRDVELLLA